MVKNEENIGADATWLAKTLMGMAQQGRLLFKVWQDDRRIELCDDLVRYLKNWGKTFCEDRVKEEPHDDTPF